MMDFIKKIFSSLFPSSESSVLGVDIGPSSIKVVQLKKKRGRAVLETYGEIILGPYGGVDGGKSTVLSTDKIAEALNDLLKEANTTTLDSGMSIPIGSSMITFIKLPTKDEKLLKEMVPIEARKYIPVPISEVNLDYWPIPKDESTISEFQNKDKENSKVNETEVLLVVIHNDALNRNKEVQNIIGLRNVFSEIEIFSCMRAVLEPNIAPQMIIDFGSSSTKAFIVERGILRASHIINKGSQDITLAISKSMSIPFEEAEKIKRSQGIIENAKQGGYTDVSSVTVDYILSEIGRMVLNYYRNNGKKVSKIILTGGGALLKGLKEKASSSFDTTVEVADPFAKVEYPAFLEKVLKDTGPEFAVAIGLAIRKLQDM